VNQSCGHGPLLLSGPGWTQRRQIDDDQVKPANAAVSRVGHHETGHLPILDPGSGEPATVVVARQHVAAAVVLGADSPEHADRPSAASTGQYP
jgi:hypothetical protein